VATARRDDHEELSVTMYGERQFGDRGPGDSADVSWRLSRLRDISAGEICRSCEVVDVFNLSSRSVPLVAEHLPALRCG
jgi:hypothetical protein